MSKLSIIITALNEQHELEPTLQSIKDTCGDAAEVIVVDDCSKEVQGSNIPNVKFIRNNERKGVGPSRHIGAEHAEGDYILLTDAHMRFEPGWYEKAMERIVGRNSTVHCGACLGLDESAMDLSKHKGVYTGATLLLHNPSTNEIFEGKWIPDKKDQDDYDIACVMGASYFFPKEFFFKIGGLKALKMWGSDEPYISLKAWRAGGDIKMMKSVRIGHKFRGAAPYSTWVPNIIYNKMRSISTILEPDLTKIMMDKFPKSGDHQAALEMLAKEANIVQEERNYYDKLFVRDTKWLCDKFNIRYPEQPGNTPTRLHTVATGKPGVVRAIPAPPRVGQHMQTS